MIQRGYRALVLWIAWSAVAIVFYASIYQDTDVWKFVEQDSSRITWGIIALFAVGIVTSFALTVLLTLESIKVDYLESVAKQTGWLGVQESDKRFCVANFFNSLKTVMTNNGELNIEALVEVEFAVYRRTAQALEVIGNLLITLGLVGTVVGLTLTLTGLTSSLEALGHDQEQLLRGLRGAMGGMGTAFYTTLLGSVLGGVLLRVYGHIDENGVDSLENALTRICLVYCSADFKPSTERDIRALNQEVQILTQKVEYLKSVLNESKSAVADFATELTELQQRETRSHSLEDTIKLRKDYLETLRQEFQLKRMIRGAWWKAFIKGFRKT
ncbi:MAG TPA: MotA/TolQ/ExbB proton channel family protein [Gammaproteobacteria bacterium]